MITTPLAALVLVGAQNDFIGKLSMMLKEAVQDMPHVYYLPTVEWTRGLGDDLGRHPCAPADPAGVHFATGTANMAHVQQVSLALNLK